MKAPGSTCDLSPLTSHASSSASICGLCCLAKKRAVAHNPAMRGIISIVIGTVMIIGGLSGKLVMRGTESGVALAVLGGVIVAIGLFRLKSSS